MSDRFAFGENWKNFVEKHFSEERAATASNNLLQSLQLKNLEGMRFFGYWLRERLAFVGSMARRRQPRIQL